MSKGSKAANKTSTIEVNWENARTMSAVARKEKRNEDGAVDGPKSHRRKKVIKGLTK